MLKNIVRIRSTYSGATNEVVCLGGYEPSAVVISRPAGTNYIQGVFTMKKLNSENIQDMTRLEFVSMSLIKGLKGVIYIGGEQEIVTLKSIDTDGNEIWVSNDNWVYSSLNYDIKIICRKLSDLTNSGTKSIGFKVRLDVANASNNGDWILLLNGVFNLKTSPFYVIEILVKNHFDIAGLIEKGEAIDVNKLEENPYK